MNKAPIENNGTHISHSSLNANKIWNRNQLKLFVVCTMLLDHTATALFNYTSLVGQLMWFLGMFTAPTMAYFVAEGYHYTHNFKKYIIRMGIFALLSWFPYYYFYYGTLPFIDGNFFVLPFTINQDHQLSWWFALRL